MTYRGVPMTSLLMGVAPDESVRLTTVDGRDLVLPASLLLGRTGSAVAYLAVESAEAPWPPLSVNDAHTAGPFYLIWTNPEKSAIAPVLWRAQVTHIETLAPLAKRFPALVPATGIVSKDPVRRGFATYVRQCAACHTLPLAGDATIGPISTCPTVLPNTCASTHCADSSAIRSRCVAGPPRKCPRSAPAHYRIAN